MPSRKGKKTDGPGGNGGAMAGRSLLTDEQRADFVELVEDLLARSVRKRTIKAAVRAQYQKVMGLAPTDPEYSATSIERLIRDARANIKAAAPAVAARTKTDLSAYCMNVWEGVIADPNSRPNDRTQAAKAIAEHRGINAPVKVELPVGGDVMPQKIQVSIINVPPAASAPITKPPKSIVIQTLPGSNGSNGGSGNGSAP